MTRPILTEQPDRRQGQPDTRPAGSPERRRPDVAVRDAGSFAVFAPATAAGRAWLQTRAISEPWQWWQGRLGVDRRSAQGLVDAMRRHGLIVVFENNNG